MDNRRWLLRTDLRSLGALSELQTKPSHARENVEHRFLRKLAPKPTGRGWILNASLHKLLLAECAHNAKHYVPIVSDIDLVQLNLHAEHNSRQI